MCTEFVHHSPIDEGLRCFILIFLPFCNFEVTYNKDERTLYHQYLFKKKKKADHILSQKTQREKEMTIFVNMKGFVIHSKIKVAEIRLQVSIKWQCDYCQFNGALCNVCILIMDAVMPTSSPASSLNSLLVFMSAHHRGCLPSLVCIYPASQILAPAEV